MRTNNTSFEGTMMRHWQYGYGSWYSEMFRRLLVAAKRLSPENAMMAGLRWGRWQATDGTKHYYRTYPGQ
jgi:hypothetical protein